MQLSNIPGKLVLPFANAGGKSTIPVASQIGITAGAASLTDGFPPLTRTPIAAGGVPPSGLDMNGILYEMSAIIRWANAGGGYPYDGTFATDTNVGGYPKGARIMRSDGTGYWFNTVENNVTDPEAAGAAAAGWVPDYQSGATSVAMSGSSVTLTPNQYGKPLIVITGTLSANLNLIFPALAQGWTVINNATGGYSITAKTASGSGVTLGTISQIVGDGTNMYAANPDSIQIVNNVATLRNVTPTLSRRIQTRGYYTDGDGADGQYYAKVGAAPGTYVHNGGTVIVPNGGDGSSAWSLDSGSFINVKWFGAKGDNSTDDFQSIENAIQWLSSIGGGIAFFPDGIYILGYALSLKSNIRYIGADRHSVTLKAASTSQDNILGWGYPLYPYMPLARAAGGTINRLTKPDFISNYTEQEALINGGFSGYAVTHVTVENITFDGNKDARPEGSMNLQGTSTGTFLGGETVTASGGKSAKVAGVFGPGYGISVDPRTVVGTFNVGNVITGAESGATMTITAKAADDAFQLNLRFDGVSHSLVRNCIFKNSMFTSLSIYNYSNNNIIDGNLFHDNNKAGTVYTAGYLNLFVEFDANYNIIANNLLIGGLGYSIMVQSIGGTNRDTVIINNTVYNPAFDGIRLSNDAGTSSIFSPRVIGNTVIGATGAGAVGIRLNHNGSAGYVTGAVVSGNTVRDSNYGILAQGRIQYASVIGNTCTNNVSTDIAITGTGSVAIGNTADSQLNDILSNKLTIGAGRPDPLQLYADGQGVGLETNVNGVGTWRAATNYPDGFRYWEFAGARKASLSPTGDFESIASIKGGKTKISGPSTVTLTSTPATIYTFASGADMGLITVGGDDGSNGFLDLLLCGAGVPKVVSSQTWYGTPPARTYGGSGVSITCSVASGTMNGRVIPIHYVY